MSEVKITAGLTMDRDEVFKNVPDRKEVLGRMENRNQGRALVHDPDGKPGKRWLHPGKSDRAKRMEQAIKKHDPR